MGDVTMESYQAQERRMVGEGAWRGFWIHAAVTAVVVVVLVIVNVAVASEFPWAIFPVIGMSIGLFVHWLFGIERGDEVMRQHQDEVERAARRLAT